MKLSPCQEKALEEFENFLVSEESEFVLSGFSGVGKTFITELFIESLSLRNKFIRDVLQTTPYRLALTATTNKAVRVLDRIIKEMKLDVEVATIHSFLKLRVRQDYQTGKEFIAKTKETKVHYNSIVFIDEASYLDDSMLKIIRECFEQSKIIFIGDRDQLLSVGADKSCVFESDRIVSKVHMITPQRNQGSINQLGHAFRNVLYGTPWPVIQESHEIEFLTGTQFKDKVIEIFTSDEYQKDPNYAKILGWTNRRVLEYNSFVRSLYTPTRPYVANEYLTTNSAIVGPGEAILLGSDVTVKTYDVSEVQISDEGIEYQDISFHNTESVFRVPLDYNQVKAHMKAFARNKDWYAYFNLKNNFADMRPSHACTVHKSQGSTYQIVFMDLADIGDNNKAREVARLMYVGTTRAKVKLYLYSSLPDKYTGN